MICKHELVFLPDGETEKWGFLCVKYTYNHHTEPKLISLYWPLSNRESKEYLTQFYPELDNPQAPELRSHGEGGFSMYRGFGSHVNFRITGSNPGQTKAIKIEETPIPQPKVRKGIDTRFNTSNGYWEKYLKSQGWVPA